MESPVVATSTHRELHRELPFTSAAPAIAREQLRRFVGNLPDATVDDAVLMTSELVTNAVLHGQPEITLWLRLETDRLTVAVTDLGDAILDCARPPPRQASGRGLVIVDALATRWGVNRTRGRLGKSVWFELV